MTDLYKLETAACLWEAALEILGNKEHPQYRVIQEYREAWGTGDLRLKIVELTDQCDAAWAKVTDDFRGCFDWDFVPDFLFEKIEGGLFGE